MFNVWDITADDGLQQYGMGWHYRLNLHFFYFFHWQYVMLSQYKETYQQHMKANQKCLEKQVLFDCCLQKHTQTLKKV